MKIQLSVNGERRSFSLLRPIGDSDVARRAGFWKQAEFIR